MDETILSTVQTHLLDSERDYMRVNKELDDFELVLEVIKKLARVREAKEQQSEDIRPIESLIEESYTRLRSIVPAAPNSMNEVPSTGIDFERWAREIEQDTRAQDPIMLSFDEGSDEEQLERKERSTRSFRIRSREGNPRSTGTMLEILKSNGNLKVKSDMGAHMGTRNDRLLGISTGAWLFAVIGMMITIGFLIADFLVAQKNLAIQIERSAPVPMQLPAITVCNGIPHVPPFGHFPTKEYPGLPLLVISAYSRSGRIHRSLNKSELLIRYPETLPNSDGSLVEDVIVSNNFSKFLRQKVGFSVKREESSLHLIRNIGLQQDGANAYFCNRIGFKNAEKLYPQDGADVTHVVSEPAVRLRVFKNRMFSACRTRYGQSEYGIHRSLVAAIHGHAGKLVEKGILDFNGADVDVIVENSILTGDKEHYKGYFDFFCNVYFFSGYFYPSVDNADITYGYNAGGERWYETGKGPYYKTSSWMPGSPFLIGPDRRALENDTYDMDGIRLYAEEVGSEAKKSGNVKPSSRLAIVTNANSMTFIFRRVNIRGKDRFRFLQSTGKTRYPRGVMSNYVVGLDFSTFETEKILASPTMSWAEFITDVFEFVGLFTGICIFTLIVAPATTLV